MTKAILSVVMMITLACGLVRADVIPVVSSPTPDPAERWAASELRQFLGELHPADDFPSADSAPADGPYILLSSNRDDPLLKVHIPFGEIDSPGEFVIRRVKANGREIGIIAGNSPQAVRDGVYSLLEQGLGHGFYLHRNAAEDAHAGNFDFTQWDLHTAPMVGERVIFNWYNFLSGVSTWNLEDYKHGIRQAARMRYTGIMLHTYGWGPFTEFQHNGVTKPVEYLQNSAVGRHWDLVHTDDVRDLMGGELFAEEGPVFGADVSKVGHGGITEENRVAKAKAMLREAGDFAVNTVGLDFNWAIDIDTTFANPQNILVTLPESARFPVGEYWLPRPDTEEGYQYFRSMVETMMSDFPAITKVTLWSRNSRSKSFGGLTTGMTRDDLPKDWKVIYDKAPAEARTPYSAGHIYHAKVAEAVRRALDESGHGRVGLGFGSWWREDPAGEMASDNFRAAHHFLPGELTFYPLDYYMAFGENASFRKQLAEIGAKRRLVVIQWAHHDDGGHLGRPYRPPVDFASKLGEAGAAGFGSIHWMTRPLDTFFKSLQNQVWSNTRNEDLRTTCNRMARDFFGGSAAGVMAEYLYDWMTTAPQFGRETGPALGGDSSTGEDKSVKDYHARARGCDRRVEILDRVETDRLSAEAHDAWKFFRAQEEWIKLFHLAQRDSDSQRQKEAIRKYTEMISHDGGPTRGELGILIQHNMKWLNLNADEQRATDAN